MRALLRIWWRFLRPVLENFYAFGTCKGVFDYRALIQLLVRTLRDSILTLEGRIVAGTTYLPICSLISRPLNIETASGTERVWTQ